MPVIRAAAVLLLLTLPAVAQPPANNAYSAWKLNPAAQRWECTYTYANKSGGTSQQLVVAYPKTNERYGWAYYYNAQGKPWGRCAIKGNPKYDPKVMYWQRLNQAGNGYEDYVDQPRGFCPAPADGRAPIPLFPDPPV